MTFYIEAVRSGSAHPPTAPTNTRTINFQQSVDDQVTFHALRGPLRAITRGGRLPAKTETMRAAMEVCAALERHCPGLVVKLLVGWKTLTPCYEAPGPSDTSTIPIDAASELLEREDHRPHPLLREADPEMYAALDRLLQDALKRHR